MTHTKVTAHMHTKVTAHMHTKVTAHMHTKVTAHMHTKVTAHDAHQCHSKPKWISLMEKEIFTLKCLQMSHHDGFKPQMCTGARCGMSCCDALVHVVWPRGNRSECCWLHQMKLCWCSSADVLWRGVYYTHFACTQKCVE